MKAITTFVLVCSLTVGGIALAQDSNTEEFLYTNEEGEEIFGPEYRPSPPDDPGLRYWIGTPVSGVEIPDVMLSMPQESFRQEFMLESAPAEDRRFRSLPVVPLRKDFDRSGALRDLFPEGIAPSLARRSARPAAPGAPPSKMWAHFVDVGQGDAAILEFPCQVAVIDVGGEFGGEIDGDELFLEYLSEFFAERPHLNNTIDVVFLTHAHADHVNGVTRLLDRGGDGPFAIGAVVDNGQTGTRSGLKKQRDFRNRARRNGAAYSAVELARQVTATGVTNGAIDPISCPEIDPVITAFWGGVENLDDEYENPNNHSVVVRVDFGEASFLFTGDLEDKGEADMRNQYESNLGVFDVDVYQVSHHGADRDTSDSLIGIMTPKIAVISMGTADGGGAKYSHPRIKTIKVMQDEPDIVSGARVPTAEFLAAPAFRAPYERVEIRRAIYGTGWEGSVIIEATSDGKYEVSTLGTK